jgi:hypothetical protein
MSVNPGENPNFDIDFGPMRSYSPEQIAEQLVWPLVDAVWWNDWRRYSHIGNQFHVSKRGVGLGGQQIDVTLSAYHDLERLSSGDDDGIPILSTAILDIEPIVIDERRDFILASAMADEPKINEWNDEHTTVKVGTAYKFYSDGEYAIQTGQTVEDIDGEAAWTKEDDDEESESYATEDEDFSDEILFETIVPPSILDHDMEMISAGLYIFNAPAAIIKALHLIKKNTVES